MKKVLVFNFNVGSAIQYCGEIFVDWLKENKDIEIEVVKDQNPETIIIDKIIDYSPDIIVINELYDRVSRPAFYYKKLIPKTKVLYLNHSWKSLLLDHKDGINDQEKLKLLFNKEFYSQTCNLIINLNYKPEAINWPPYLENKTFSSHFPIESIFSNNIPWLDRENMFVILGNITSLKISEEFISLLKGSGLKIDCYGMKYSKSKEDEKYLEKFESCNELVYKGFVQQRDVPSILNKYKYYVMPHNGTEVFNLALLQAIYCGTIPLISNDRNNTKYDGSWIDWADGLYFGCKDASSLLENLIEINKETPDHSTESKLISETATKKFPCDRIKLIFSIAMKCLMEDTNHGSNNYNQQFRP